jgi:hypothetical protein
MSEDTSVFLYKFLTGALLAQDGQRDRSLQKEIGPSQLGGCRRQVYYQLIEQPEVNTTEKLPAMLGTFIHEGIAKAIKREDPFGDNLLIEQELNEFGIPAHTDLYIRDKRLVVDWKTTTKASLRYFPSDQQVWQAQVYAHMLKASGEDPLTVALVTIPRDGKLADIAVHHEPYDPVKAEAALTWLKEVKESAAKKELPDAEKPKHFCRMYCPYFDESGEVGCASLKRG